MSSSKHIAIQLLSDWMHLVGIQGMVDKFHPGKDRNINYMIKKRIPILNGDGRVIRRKMRLSGTVLSCLMHPAHKRRTGEVPEHEQIEERVANLHKVVNQEIAELIIEILT